MPNYNDLPQNADKVRINAIIMDAIEHNRGGFADKLIAYSRAGAKDSEGRKENFQFMLDRVRDSLAKDLPNLPQIEAPKSERGEPKSQGQYLGIQREHLMKIRDAIGSGIKEVSNIQGLADKAQHRAEFNGSEYEMPAPKTAYGKLNQALESACKLAESCKKVSGAISSEPGEKAAAGYDPFKDKTLKPLGGMMRI